MKLNWKKIYSWEIFFFYQTTIYLSIGLHKGRPSYKRSLQLSKENIQHVKKLNFLIFSTSVGYFCPPGTGSGSADLIKSGSNTNPDPQRWFGTDYFHYGYELFEIVFDNLIIGLWGYCPSCEKNNQNLKKNLFEEAFIDLFKKLP